MAAPRETSHGPFSLRVAECDRKGHGSAQAINATDQPFHAATVDQPAAQLGHSRLGNSEAWGNEMLGVGTKRACDLARELTSERVDRVVGRAGHPVSTVRHWPAASPFCRVGITSKRFSAGAPVRRRASRGRSGVALPRRVKPDQLPASPIRSVAWISFARCRSEKQRCSPQR